MALPVQDMPNNLGQTADFVAWLRLALDFMRSPQGDPAYASLFELELVQRVAARLDGLPAVSLLQQALDCLLVTFISGGLAHHRRIMGLPPLIGAETRQQALNALARDAHCAGRELLSWDVLYYRYVRVDLDFTDAQFGRIVHLDERTLRRYRQLGVQRLATWLLRAELHLRAYGPETSNPVLAALLTHDPLDQIIDLEILLRPTGSYPARARPHLAGWGARR